MLYIYSFLVSVDHYPCSNESQFEKWWHDRKQNHVGVRSTDTTKCVMLKLKLKIDTNTNGHV
jgi:hypothetical protein